MADHGAPNDAIVSSSQISKQEERFLSDLGDDMLIEILQRLPTAKDAFLCSSVCNNWYRIIFSPHFISRFVTYHANLGARNENSISLVIRNQDSATKAMILPENPLSEILTIDFTRFCKEISWVGILSSCQDLLLCLASIEQGFTFLICNPVTAKGFFVSLPKWMKASRYYEDTLALVVEPYSSVDSLGGCILDAGFRYRMVRFELGESLLIEIYCSESGQFVEEKLFGEEFMKKVCSNLVVYNGKVHWCNRRSILAYDPFRIRIDGIKEDNTEADAIGDSCFVIKCPDCIRESSNNGASFKLGVCRGLLRLMCVEFDSVLKVWDLQDYEQGKWSVERKFFLNSLVRDHQLHEALEESFNVVAPHPYDEDLVYFSLGVTISLCNLETKELNKVAKISSSEQNYWMGYDDECDSIGNPIVIPWWPTPTSSLQQENAQQ